MSECPDCGGCGYDMNWDGTDNGACNTCSGEGTPPAGAIVCAGPPAQEDVIEGRIVEPGEVDVMQEFTWAMQRLGDAIRESMINVQAVFDAWDWYEPHQPGKPHRYSDKYELLARVQDHWKDTHL